MLPERVPPEPPPAVLAGHERVLEEDALRLDASKWRVRPARAWFKIEVDAGVRVRRQLARVVEVVAGRRERRLVHARPPLRAGRDVAQARLVTGFAAPQRWQRAERAPVFRAADDDVVDTTSSSSSTGSAPTVALAVFAMSASFDRASFQNWEGARLLGRRERLLLHQRHDAPL